MGQPGAGGCEGIQSFEREASWSLGQGRRGQEDVHGGPEESRDALRHGCKQLEVEGVGGGEASSHCRYTGSKGGDDRSEAATEGSNCSDHAGTQGCQGCWKGHEEDCGPRGQSKSQSKSWCEGEADQWCISSCRHRRHRVGWVPCCGSIGDELPFFPLHSGVSR